MQDEFLAVIGKQLSIPETGASHSPHLREFASLIDSPARTADALESLKPLFKFQASNPTRTTHGMELLDYAMKVPWPRPGLSLSDCPSRVRVPLGLPSRPSSRPTCSTKLA